MGVSLSFSAYRCILPIGAENIAKEDGMVSGPLDLRYMGVYTLWANDLGIVSPKMFFLAS